MELLRRDAGTFRERREIFQALRGRAPTDEELFSWLDGQGKCF